MTPFKLFLTTIVVAAIGVACVGFALGQDDQEIRFEDHKFTPQTLSVPSGQKLTIKVVNASNETIEFESFRLNREKVVTPGQTISVHLPELSAGAYDFYDDFHQDVPQGSIVAK
ncbi:MAG: cupredoxin domain-containing protein [Deltaproteobacteria bacterium]|nr:cupredoxin domain-containing protein [Deltaproteobacteria bacterium]